MESLLTPEVEQIVTIVAAGLVLITAILWLFLPFAVFGIKDRIDHQAELSADILAELQGLREDLRLAEQTRVDSFRGLPPREDRPAQ